MRLNSISVKENECRCTWIVFFATPREGLAMMHLDGIEDGLQGLPKFMHDWEFIEATEEETF